MDAWEYYQSLFEPRLRGKLAVRDLQEEMNTPSFEDKIKIPPLEEPVYNTIMDKVGGTVLGGLSALGAAIEKPGRAIRGILGGNMREGLNFIPFSDYMGLTKYEDRVSGRDLGRQWGWMDDENNWGNFFGGMGIEMGLDPLTFVTGIGSRAFGAGGQAAKALGMKPTSWGTGLKQTFRDLASEYAGKPGYGDVAQRLGEYAAKTGRTVADIENAPINHFLQFGLPFGLGGDTYRIGVGGGRLYDYITTGYNAVGTGAKAVGNAIKPIPIVGSTIGGTVDLADKVINQALPFMARYGRAYFQAPARNSVTAEVQPIQMANARFTPGAEYMARNLNTAVGRVIADELSDIPAATLYDMSVIPENFRFQNPANPETFKTLRPEAQTLLKDQVIADLLENSREIDKGGKIVSEGGKTLFIPNQTSSLFTDAEKVNTIADQVINKIDELGAKASPEALKNTIAQEMGLAPGMVPDSKELVYVLSRVLRKEQEKIGNQLRTAGVDLGDWKNAYNPMMKYGHREVTLGDNNALNAFNDFATSHPNIASDRAFMGHRAKPLDVFSEGRSGINFAFNDPRIMDPAITPKDAAQDLLTRYGSAIDPALKALPETIQAAEDSVNILRRIRSLSGPDQLAVYGNSPVVDSMNYGLRAANVRSAADTAGAVLKANTIRSGADPSLLKDIYVPIESALKKANLDIASEPFSGLAGGYVRNDIAEDLFRSIQSTAPKGPQGAIANLYNNITQIWKAVNTSLFPGFHGRNYIGGSVSNLFNDAGLDSIYKQGAARRIFSGTGATDLESELAREAFATGAISPINVANDIAAGMATQPGQSLDNLLSQIPGNTPLTLTDAIKTYAGFAPDVSMNPLSANPFKPFLDKSVPQQFAPLVGGQKMGTLVEGINRLPQYMALRNKGYSPLGAGQEVLATHYNYNPMAYTQFERDKLKPLAPFYAWSRNNLPRQFQNIVMAPGSPSGQYARLALNLRQDNDQFLPEYLGTGLSIPIGAIDEQGKQRYLTRFDTPMEQGFDWLKPNIYDAGMGFLGQLNPMFKAPMELATGRQFFTGRDLEDLHSLTNITWMDQLLANSFGRLSSMARQIGDPRKWDMSAPPYIGAGIIPINQLSGIRFSDVDLEKYRDIRAREYVKDAMRGREDMRFFETVSPTRESLYQMVNDPRRQEDLMLMRLQKTIEKRARDRKKEEKENPKPEKNPIVIR